MPSLPRSAEDEEAEQVATWLAARPRFLVDRPTLYRRLVPPRRVHGEVLADHMAAMLAAERDASRDVALHLRQGDALLARVQRAVLALLRSPDPAETVSAEWPALLGLDAVTLCREGEAARHWRALPAGSLARLLPPSRNWVLRDAPALPDAATLHAEAAPLIARDALLRLRPGMLLALGTREAALLPRRGAGPALLFLAQAAAAALGATRDAAAGGP
ncbi:hypothetical protein [Roseomonas sp. BN140053]|uniref:hypothetical protein n=1 Tax=Roseomonas sp. BN140053 TaxID=3391898 RepID=UPI0039EAAB65